jgi:single-strand DNA-binding protein
MSTTITGKLNKAATQFQAGDSTGFGIRLGVKYQDPKTKQDDWCNYQAVIFAKSPAQIQFYADSLVEGSVVEVFCEKQSIEQYQGNNGLQVSINMLNARLGHVHTGQQPAQSNSGPNSGPNSGQRQTQQQQPQRQPAPQGYQQGYQQAPQGQQPPPMAEPNFNYDDETPF